jgi:hypothetical protein
LGRNDHLLSSFASPKLGFSFLQNEESPVYQGLVFAKKNRPLAREIGLCLRNIVRSVANFGNAKPIFRKVKMMAKSSTKSGSHSPMNATAAARIQSATARVSGGQVAAGSFAARAQAAAAHNGNGSTGGKSGGNQ